MCHLLLLLCTNNKVLSDGSGAVKKLWLSVNRNYAT